MEIVFQARPSTMIRPVRLFRIILGILLILVGTVGHLVPLFPGTYFIVAGILVLAEAVPAVRRRLQHIEDRYPVVHRAIARLRSPDGSLDLWRVAFISLGAVLVFGTLFFLVVRFIGNQ